MGEKNHEGRTWPFGHGGHGNQNPRLNPRNGASDGGWEGDNGGNQDHNGGNTGTTATYRPAPTAQQTTNPTANGPNTTQRQQTNYPTQAPAPGQPTYAQGDNGGQRTQPTQPDRGQPAHTTISDSTRSMTVVLGETTFATRYTDYDTLAIDTHAPTFSSGPLPTSGAGSYNNNNLNSASNYQQGGGANGTANYQSADGGLGGGTIAGIIVGVVLVLVISLVALFFHRKRALARRGNNSPYGKHHPEEASSSLLDNGLAATVGAGAAAVGARSGGGHRHGQAEDASSSAAAALRNTPAAQQQQSPSMQQTNNNSQYLVPASSSSPSRTAPYTAPRPAPPPPPSSSHSSNFSLSMITPPPTHISSAFAPGAVSPISTVSPAVMGPPSPLLSDEEKEIGTLGHRRPSIESVSTFSVHSAMMTASQINWPMPPSVASTSSPSVPLTKTPSRPVPVPAPHYVDFEEQGRTVVRINRESLTGGIGKAR